MSTKNYFWKSNKIFTLDLKNLLFIISFLLFFQFFGSLFSFLKLNFEFLLLISFVLGLISACLFANNKSYAADVSKSQIFLTVILTLFSLLLFLLRINWGLFDLICPTGLLGLVTQVSVGKFPVSFLSFPDFPMNYHQGFIFIAGSISFITGLLPAISIKLLYIFAYILVVLSLTAYFISSKSRYYLLPALLLIFISSVSLTKFFNLGFFYNYVNVSEYLTSNSWPLALLGLVLLLFLGANFNNSISDKIKIFAVVLSMSTINGTVFSLLLVSGLLFAIINLKYFLKDRSGVKSLLVYAICLSTLYLLPRFIPSVFLVGKNYEAPQYAIRFFNFGFRKYILNMGHYIFLSGPLTVVAVTYSIAKIKLKKIGATQYFSVLLLISFFFPIVILFKNIDSWDNIHKFAILNLFLSSIIVVIALSENIFFFTKRNVFIAILICLLFSLPADYDIFKNRSSLDFTKNLYPDSKISDVVDFLKTKKDKKILIPYNNNLGGMCDVDDFSAIAQFSGYYIKSNYFTNFLLSSKIEDEYTATEKWWQDKDLFVSTIANLKNSEYIIVRRANKDEFIKASQGIRNFDPISSTIEFNNFVLLYK